MRVFFNKLNNTLNLELYIPLLIKIYTGLKLDKTFKTN